MSDTSILPGAEPATDAGIGMVPPGTDSEESGGGDRRRLLILGAIAAVVVLAAAAFMLLHKGSSAAPAGAVPTGVPATTSQSSTNGSVQGATNKPTGNGTTAGSGKQGTSNQSTTALPKKANHPQARDPFHALVTAPVDTSGGATSTTTVAAPTTPTDGSTTTTTGTAPTDGSTGTTTGTGTTGTTSAANTPVWIQLMSVHGRMATFDVGYVHHKFRRYHVQAPLAGVHQGTVFDKVFALVGISGGQVSLQIGDDAPFQLTTGIAHTVGG